MAQPYSARSRAIEPFHVMALLARAIELQAAGGGVAGFTVCYRGLTGLDDRFGRGEVRLADFQVDHVVTGCLQLIGTRQ